MPSTVVGAAEAGFLPGILLYLTYWFPRSCRARANALFIMGIPATIAIASTISGLKRAARVLHLFRVIIIQMSGTQLIIAFGLFAFTFTVLALCAGGVVMYLFDIG